MIEDLDNIIMFSFGPIDINATLFYSWIVMAVLVGGSWLITRNLKTTLQVSRFQTLLEMIVSTIRDQIREVSGDNPVKYLPMMGTFFLFIAMSNLLTIIPWFKAPTSSLSTTAAFALCVFCAMPYYGIKNAGILGYLKKFIDPTPLMLPLNVLSDFSSAFSLAFRLYGNMLSGAVIITVLMMLAPFLIPLPLQILGLVTGMIQAYIFALLAIVYVSAVAPKEAYVQPDTKKGV
jgi:F-type H+-transporting ATPase subunit a